MERDKIEFAVFVNGVPVKEYGHKGSTYIESREKVNYTLKVRNSYAHRVLVVPSIDGLNPLNGKETINNDEGYVVPAYGSVTIDGWRTSLSSVSKFVFDKKTQSYTAKTGHGTANCGVVGIQVFKEKVVETKYVPVYYPQPYYVYPWHYMYPPIWCYTNPNTHTYGNNTIGSICNVNNNDNIGNSCNMTFSSCSSNQNTGLCANPQESAPLRSSGIHTTSFSNDSTQNQQVTEQINSFFSQVVEEPHQHGTGWGEEAESFVTQATFDKGDLLQTLEIYYAPRKGLEALGIDLTKSTKVAFSKPQAFSNFCKPPVS